ncbi:hypothetical protein NM688_g360 [Phlebia brevispora]|uniref:Uncharacterized protein n=1 Tax=Phlebia brevispora TaxID=194682 RepID=A0ACC1TEE4_9APHY|nr:hypothetical protein NM688_g360 [Phlebia brevispora]
MPPKKAQKMSLNEFLGDSTLGSWADEMDSLPTAPAARSDDDRFRPGMGERRRDDYMSSRGDRGPSSFREDLPLPTEPPFTAFIGNLAFDLTDTDLEEFFAGHATKSVKIIKDREDKPKGFGYVEFAELDGLKDALSKSGTTLAGRAVRISVAEPPKERSGFGGSGGFDDEKFAGNWRRDGPLPELSSRDGSRRRFEGSAQREPPPPSVSDNINDWRSSRPPARGSPGTTTAELDGPSFRRRGSGFRSQEGAPAGAADSEEHWTMGSKFRPSGPPEGPGSRFGGARGKSDTGFSSNAANPGEDTDWRRPRTLSRNSTSPGNSVPPTPQMGRRKLELLPRSSTSNSGTPSPLSSPNPANAPHHPRSNPFGAAKPVDTLAKEEAIAARLEKEREQVKERISHHTMSRTSSRNASHRGEPRPVHTSAVPPTPTSPKSPKAEPKAVTVAANVRPSFSFASAAAGKKDAAPESEAKETTAEEIADKVAEVEI